MTYRSAIIAALVTGLMTLPVYAQSEAVPLGWIPVGGKIVT
jgi:hypothetical protein